MQSLTEAMAMTEQSGVDVQAAVDMLTPTLFTARIYQSYGARTADKTASFSSTAIPLKDLSLFETIARHARLATPIAERLRDTLKSAER